MFNAHLKVSNNNALHAANKGDFLTAENEFKKAFNLIDARE